MGTVTEGKAQDLVNGAALVVAAIYFYRKLIEPATGGTAAASSAGTGATPAAGESILTRFRGPAGSFESPGEPATIPGAAAQLLGKGKPAPTERFVVGWGFVFLSLSLAVPVAPELAGAFAALTALGAVLGNGAQVSKDLESQLHHEATPEASTANAAPSSPTTTVSYAGQGAASVPAVFPEKSPAKKTRPKKTRFRVQSA